MKQCPESKRAYTDETLNFCLDDDERLTARGDEAATAILRPGQPSPADPTRLIGTDFAIHRAFTAQAL